MSIVVINNRFFWADACRVLAIFGVILIHSCGEVFYSYGKIPIFHWLLANFFDSLARVAVPLFVMISGGLLLKSTDHALISLENIAKRISKVLPPLIAWSMVYLWWIDYNTPNKAINPFEWLQKLLSEPVMYHLWFVYMIIGLYIISPMLQVVFKACETNPSFKWYFLIFWLFTNSLSVYISMPFIAPMQIMMIFGYGGYFIIGGLLNSRYCLNVGFLKCAIFYLTGVIATFLITWMRTSSSGVPDELAYSYFSPNVLLASIGAFMLIRKMRVPDERKVRIIKLVSDACFIIYFVHVLVLEFLRYGTFGVRISTNEIHPGISIPTLALATFVCSLAFAGVVRLIPGSRRVFG